MSNRLQLSFYHLNFFPFHNLEQKLGSESSLALTRQGTLRIYCPSRSLDFDHPAFVANIGYAVAQNEVLDYISNTVLNGRYVFPRGCSTHVVVPTTDALQILFNHLNTSAKPNDPILTHFRNNVSFIDLSLSQRTENAERSYTCSLPYRNPIASNLEEAQGIPPPKSPHVLFTISPDNPNFFLPANEIHDSYARIEVTEKETRRKRPETVTRFAYALPVSMLFRNHDTK
ncbi:hypothetical protein J4410_06705 [Candidatus Woesearchaeota archaeon]|nr:hypothetical protein [Candidatus Woesearchaeota archaeon]